ncbi:MAG: hypothetical protein WAZ36_11830 [Sediminibacterium sp.]
MSAMANEIKEFLEHVDTRCGKAERMTFQSGFNLSPDQFLDFAKEDLKTDLKHKFINSLSNAKKAVDCHIDLMLQAFGYYEVSKKKRWGFPDKQAKMSQIGIAAPAILNKLNKLRNLMEHEFVNPSQDEVIDFVDVTDLFIRATESSIKGYCPYLEMENETTGLKMCFHLGSEKKEITLRTYDIAYDSYTDYKNSFAAPPAPPVKLKIWLLADPEFDQVLTYFVASVKRIGY